MPAKRKKGKESPTVKAKTDKEVTKKKASFKVVEKKPAEEKVTSDVNKTKEGEVSEGKEAPKTEPTEETLAEQKSVEESDKAEKAEAETVNKIPSITSFSQLDSQSSTPANSDSPPSKKSEEEKVEEIKKDEKAKKDLSSENVKEWLKDVRPDTTKEVEKKRGSGSKVIITIIVVLAILGIITGGVFYYQTGFNKKTEAPEVQEQNEIPVATETPKPTPEEVDLSEFSVNILNGSGIAGEARKIDELLVNLSFASTETGNADSYNYTTTVVSLKEGVSNQVYTKIKEALVKNYIVEKSDDLLEDNFGYDVKIIVGSQKAE